MTIVEAIRISRNTIPVKILQQLGTDRSLEFMRTKLGFTTLDDRDNDLGAARGRVADQRRPSGRTDGGLRYLRQRRVLLRTDHL